MTDSRQSSIPYIQSGNGVVVGVFVPIEVWHTIEPPSGTAIPAHTENKPLLRGTSPTAFRHLAGTMSPAEANAMQQTIDTEFGQIEHDSWK